MVLQPRFFHFRAERGCPSNSPVVFLWGGVRILRLMPDSLAAAVLYTIPAPCGNEKKKCILQSHPGDSFYFPSLFLMEFTPSLLSYGLIKEPVVHLFKVHKESGETVVILLRIAIFHPTIDN